jgi:hypothetical protein
MHFLLILCYSGSLVTGTVVSLTIAKFKLLIFSMFGFAFSQLRTCSFSRFFYDFCLLSTILLLNLIQVKIKVEVMLRPTLSRPVCFGVKPPIWDPRPHFFHCQTVSSSMMWGALSDKRTCLPFTIAAGPRQRSHSRVRVLRDLWPYFTVSHSTLHQPGGPGPSVHIPKEQGSSGIPPGIGFPFRRFLRLPGKH